MNQKKKREATLDELVAENKRLQAQIDAAGKMRNVVISFKVSDKGAVSVYGLGRFPVTLYKQQWERLIPEFKALQAFIDENESRLSVKE
jgi:hypothetical protein